MRTKIGLSFECFFKLLFGTLVLGILLLLVLGASHISYGYKVIYQYPNWLYLLIGVLNWTILYIAEQYCPKGIKKFICEKKNTIVIFLTFSLFVILVYCVYNYYFVPGWDPGTLINSARILVNGNELSEYEKWYFSAFPNNILLTFMFSIIVKVQKLFGILDVSNGIMGVLTVQCLCLTIAGAMVYKITFIITGRVKIALNSWIMYVMVIGVSPWVSIPYSDSMGILYPILILYIYLTIDNGKNVLFKWFLIAFFSVIGYKIKPQLLIIFIAIVIVKSIVIMKEDKIVVRKYIKNWVAISVGIITAFFVIQIIVVSTKIELNKENEFGPLHFVMMGLNSENDGGFSIADVNYTQAQSKNERAKANFNEIKYRIEKFGGKGLAEHLVKKLLVNYGDGTWGWGCEGNFILQRLDDKNQKMSPFLKSLYYPDGVRHNCFQNYAQMMWMLVLFGLFMEFVLKGNDELPFDITGVIMLAVLGLTLFELIFEARARYLFCYVPVYIVLASVGLEKAQGRFMILCKKKFRKQV